MADENKIVRERQKLIRRQMDERGISVKAVQLDGGWESSSTVLSYFPADQDAEPAVMSVAALYRLLSKQALPADLLSLLLPGDFAIVRVPEGIDHDVVCEAFQDYLAEKAKAHRPESECGPAIGPKEHDKLTKLAVVAGTAVAA